VGLLYYDYLLMELASLVDNLCLLLTDGGMVLCNIHVSAQEVPFVAFLKELMRRRKRLLSQLAADLGVSHATVSRWLSEDDIPSTRSCRMTKYLTTVHKWLIISSITQGEALHNTA